MRRRIVPSLRTQSQTALTTGALVLVGLVGFLDWIAGYELSFSLFYFAPILLGTWLVGSRLGVAVASLSTLVWLGEDLASGRAFVHPLIPFWNALMRVSCFLIVVLLVAWLKRSYEEQRRIARELQESLAKVKILSGLIPICAWCKKVRNDEGYWQQVEAYIAEHSEATFTHGICQECKEMELQAFLHT
jgi:hypothetical protein